MKISIQVFKFFGFVARRRNLRFVPIAALLLASVSLVAQAGSGPTGVSHHYKPGDTLHYTVTFDGNPSFDSVGLYFVAGEVPPDQSGLTNALTVGRSKKVSAGKFEVEEEIPANAASGTYRLSQVQAGINPNGGKGYDASSFHESIEIDNGVRYEFPPLKSVVPK